MPWYRLKLPLRTSELNEKVDEYRDLVQGAIARFGGRDMAARVYCDRRHADAEVFIEIEGRQPSWLTLRMMRCESIEPPHDRAELELLGEVANGAAGIAPGAARTGRSL